MKYKNLHGKKYQTTKRYVIETGIIPPIEIKTDEIKLSITGRLTIRKGYCWDGATGAFDTDDFMRGSLTHDVFCELIASKILPQSYRKSADKLLRKILIEDGMSKVRAFWVYHTVRFYVKAAY